VNELPALAHTSQSSKHRYPASHEVESNTCKGDRVEELPLPLPNAASQDSDAVAPPKSVEENLLLVMV
jgi:hypothetical protein